jgi:hypothetical protein
MHRTRGARAVTVVAVIGLTACSAALSPTPTATVSRAPTLSPSPTAEPTPTPTPDLAAIGAAYLSAVEPSNEATCAFNTALSAPSATLDQMKQASSDFAAALRTWADVLRTMDWPADLASDANDLIKAISAEESAAIALAAAPSLADFYSRLVQLNATNTAAGAAANQIRGDLGLPSVSVPCS